AGLMTALRATAARSGPGGSSTSARGSSLLRARCLRVLVQHFCHLVQRLFHVLGCGTQARHSAFVNGLLGLFDGRLGLLHVGIVQLVAVVANRLFGLVHDAVQTVARLHFFHPLAVVFRVRFGLDPHLLGLFLGQTGGSRDGDLLFLVGGLVLCAH